MSLILIRNYRPTQSLVGTITGQALANPFDQEDGVLSQEDRVQIYDSIENKVALRDYNYFLQLEDFNKITVRILDEYQTDKYGNEENLLESLRGEDARQFLQFKRELYKLHSLRSGSFQDFSTDL